MRTSVTKDRQRHRGSGTSSTGVNPRMRQGVSVPHAGSCEGWSEVPVQGSHVRPGATGFPGRRAGVAARSGREAGGVSCDGRCLDLAGSIRDLPASATGGPSSPAIRMRVPPPVLRAKLSPAMPLSPGSPPVSNERPLLSPGHAAPASQRPYRSANWPPRASSWSGGPASTTRPSWITAIWSASITVESRWAITMVVRP
jgi:hypothetical protein